MRAGFPVVGSCSSIGSILGVIPFRKNARSLEIHVSGGDYNVAANLADCFGLKTGIATTAMVNYPIGELVQSRVRETGVTPFYKFVEHDGVRGPNIATVYRDRGFGRSPAGGLPIIGQMRRALLKPGDSRTGLASSPGGVRWFHSGGIFASLSETTAPLIIEGMQAARAAGAITSFDLNYRAKLWASCRGRTPSEVSMSSRRSRVNWTHSSVMKKIYKRAWVSPARS